MNWRIGLAAALAALSAACVNGGGDHPQADIAETSEPPQPRHATYRCEDGSELTVDNLQTSVMVARSEETGIALPASPPGQATRYGQGIHALLLDGSEALWMVNRQTPLACRR